MISIIAAIGKSGELGKDNKLLWHIPEDLKRFKKLTSGHSVVMGRKTFESIGKPLPKRINIVVTHDIKTFIEKFEIRNSKFEANSNFQNSNVQNCFEFNKNFIVCSSLEKAIEKAKKRERNEIFIIGGGKIYSQAIDIADKIYLTLIEGSFDADTFFPDYSDFKKIIHKETHHNDQYTFTFLELTQ